MKKRPSGSNSGPTSPARLQGAAYRRAQGPTSSALHPRSAMRSPTALDDWRQAITDGIRQWNATLAVECEFTRYDDLFAAAPPDPATVAEAILEARPAACGTGDLLSATARVVQSADRLRWTAGMWRNGRRTTACARRRVSSAEHVEKFQPVSARTAQFAYQLRSLRTKLAPGGDQRARSCRSVLSLKSVCP